ncbi:MAG: lipopolysaccharide kinase InaA family protein, partial [Planctomycetaceae bacterium]
MRSFAFERWDDGRLTVNRDFAPLLRAHGLTTFHALMHEVGGEVAKNLLRERTTSRFRLEDEDGSHCDFYIKRHRPPPVKEYVKPLLRLTWPVLGARNEWNALLDFHAAGISTMTPVALGEAGGESFLVTESLDGCTKLS